MNIREQQEEFERKWLSPFATKSYETKGRATPEEKCSMRTDFQRDKDRIIYSKAFRRLKHKTQVFIYFIGWGSMTDFVSKGTPSFKNLI